MLSKFNGLCVRRKETKHALITFLFLVSYKGARGSVVGWRTMLQAGRWRDRVPMRFQPHYGLVVHSASNRNNIPGGRGRILIELGKLLERV
jgi:hypothetical protein